MPERVRLASVSLGVSQGRAGLSETTYANTHRRRGTARKAALVYSINSFIRRKSIDRFAACSTAVLLSWDATLSGAGILADTKTRNSLNAFNNAVTSSVLMISSSRRWLYCCLNVFACRASAALCCDISCISAAVNCLKYALISESICC